MVILLKINLFRTLFFSFKFLILFLVTLSCAEFNSKTNSKKPKIGIIGLGIESSTFSPAKTIESDFIVKKGDQMFDWYKISIDSINKDRANWVPLLVGYALPGGIVTEETYNSLVNKSLDLLKKNAPYDGILFDIHGAMSVENIDDPEGDYIERVRSVVGKNTIISTTMDLHGNVSWRLAKNSDLITCYRMAPHEDAKESDKRAIDNLLERLESGKGKPKYKAWIPIPILLPGEKTSTRVEPAKSLYAKVNPVTKTQGVLDAAIWVGYPWADEPRNHAVVMVTGDNKDSVKLKAEYLAESFWDVRDKFEFIAPTASFEKSLSLALKSNVKPFIISDMGDNPTAGGAGDVTWTLNEILKNNKFKDKDGPSLIYASIPGPQLISKAIEKGVGSKVKGFIGAEVDDRYSPPILLEGIVKSIKKGDVHAKTEVVIQKGSLSIIVTQKRKPYHYIKDFTDLGLDVSNSNILVVKIGYLVPELYNIRADWIMALTPGGVDQDIERLDYKRINRPMFPMDKNMKKPDLSARFVPLSDQ